MKTAFIRIPACSEVTKTSAFHNYQVGDIVEYSFNDIVAMLKDWASTKKMIYYAIEHNTDEFWNGKHYHIVLDFLGTTTPGEQVKKRFPFGYIETCGRVKRCVQYLVHLNDSTKAQYKWESIIHNDDKGLARFQIQKRELSFDELLRKIGSGEIREYEIVDYIDPVTYAKKKRQIDTVVEYYIEKRMKEPERTYENRIRVIVIQGPTRLGKTDIAKMLCKVRNKSFCMSGSGNDPWEPYRGQDCMIIDDLRDSSFTISTMIKMLDPYNSTLIHRRYHNACFLGNEIIITTNEPIWSFYVGENVHDESRRAFFSRMEWIVDFFEDTLGHALFRLVRYNREKDRFERDRTVYLYDPYYKIGNEEKDALQQIARESNDYEEIFDFFEVVGDGRIHYKLFEDDNTDYMRNSKSVQSWSDGKFEYSKEDVKVEFENGFPHVVSSRSLGKLIDSDVNQKKPSATSSITNKSLLDQTSVF